MNRASRFASVNTIPVPTPWLQFLSAVHHSMASDSSSLAKDITSPSDSNSSADDNFDTRRHSTRGRWRRAISSCLLRVINRGAAWRKESPWCRVDINASARHVPKKFTRKTHFTPPTPTRQNCFVGSASAVWTELATVFSSFQYIGDWPVLSTVSEQHQNVAAAVLNNSLLLQCFTSVSL